MLSWRHQKALEFKNKTMKVEYKTKGQPVTEADVKIDNYLKNFFKRKTPNFGWLSEETEDDGSRFKNEYFLVFRSHRWHTIIY